MAMAGKTPSDRWYETVVRRTPTLTREEERKLTATLDAHRAVIARDVLGSRHGLAHLRELAAGLEARTIDVRSVIELEADARVEDARVECLAHLARITRLARRRRTSDVAFALENELRDLALRRAHVDAVVARMRRAGRSAARALGRLAVASEAAAGARSRLVESHLRLVAAIARRHTDRGLELPDLVQEGTIGLMRAVDRFELRHQVAFATYAAWWVRQTIGRALLNRARPVRLPGSVEDGLRAIHKHRRHLTLTNGRAPSRGELARAAGLPEARVDDLAQIEQDFCRPMVPYDDPVADDAEGRTPADLLAAATELGPEQMAMARRLASHASQALAVLAPREQQVLRLRYGLGRCGEHTLEDIGRKYGLTRQRILQIAAKALEKLRTSRHARPLHTFWEP
jgi:RNA polymerase sigma factor (sigma-70 family)